MPKIIPVEQGSSEWLQYKVGRASGSNIWKVEAKGKGNAPSASTQEYEAQLAIERLTNKPVPTFQTDAMRNGTLREPDARAKYEFVTDRQVSQIGCIQHPTLEWACSSPDGIVGENFEGAIEVKSPTYTTHYQTLLAKQDGLQTIQGKYYSQILWLFACAPEIQWCDFISYQPDFPEGLSLYVERVTRKGNEEAIATLEKKVAIFLDNVARAVDRLRSSYALKEAA